MIYVSNTPQPFLSNEVSYTTTQTAGTGAITLIPGITLTPDAGIYLVWFSCVIVSATAGASATIALYSGGTQKTDSVRTVSPFDGGALSALNGSSGLALNGRVTVNGSQAIEIRWNATNAGITSLTGTMDILKVG